MRPTRNCPDCGRSLDELGAGVALLDEELEDESGRARDDDELDELNEALDEEPAEGALDDELPVGADDDGFPVDAVDDEVPLGALDDELAVDADDEVPCDELPCVELPCVEPLRDEPHKLLELGSDALLPSPHTADDELCSPRPGPRLELDEPLPSLLVELELVCSSGPASQGPGIGMHGAAAPEG